MKAWEQLTGIWQRANMTVGKLVLILVLIAICTVLALGNQFGADSSTTSSTTTTATTGAH